jgi:hypothetical protein
MTKPQNFRERSFAIFQPSIYSAGVRGYPVYGSAGNYGFLPGLDVFSTLLTAGSVASSTAKTALDYTGQGGNKSQIEPNTDIWYGYANDMANPWGGNTWRGPLKDINQLAAKVEMERPSATEAGARLKSAYWLGVAGRACASDSKGRENLLDMGTQWAQQGRTEGLTEGAINRTNKTKSIYSAALNAVRQYAADEDPEARANSVFASVQGILSRGASDEGQSAALSDIKAEQAEDEKTEANEPPPPKCEDTFPGNLLPNYCTSVKIWKGIGIATGVVVGLVALRVVVKQVKKTAKAVRGED